MISIVIPLYNKAHTIIGTLSSVFNQTYTDFEVIIINDGSKDNGVELINENFNDSRIIIVNQENQGVSVARDRGVIEAHSNYIAFLDADDQWHPDYLLIMSKAISLYPDAAIYSSGGLIQNANGSVSYRLVNKFLNKIVVCDFFENPHAFIHTSSAIINRSIFLLTEGSPHGMLRMEDLALFFQLALKGSFVYAGFPISKYVGGVQGQATENFKDKTDRILKHICFFYNFVKEKNKLIGNNSLNAFITYALRHNIKFCLISKDYISLDYYLNHLSKDCLLCFYKWELYLYKHNFASLSIFWINITKFLWRLSGKPVVNRKIDLMRIDKKYLNW